MERHGLVLIVVGAYKEVEKVQYSQEGNKIIVIVKFATVNIIC
uniref:Uncharacterized protein n=1 Tax=Arundo donax TaxID=35708 RepID=A0A0A9BBY8_ARUDO